MQHINLSKSKRFILGFTVVVLLLFGITSCNKEEAAPDLIKFKGILNGWNLFPTQGSPIDKGEVSATYNPETKVFSYTLYWVSLNTTITDVIFYYGAAGSNGIEITRLEDFPTTSAAKIQGTILVPDDLEKQLLAGNFYVTICSAYYLTGEARAQFTKDNW